MKKIGGLHWLFISMIVVVVDQATKYFAIREMMLFHPYHILPFFNLTLEYNPGAAFSFLSYAGGWQRWFFAGIAVAICTLILIWLYRLPREKKWLAIALCLIFGGAISNLWDRISLGFVIDFLDLYIKHWHWPVFNIADSAITIGVVMLVIDFFVRDQDSRFRGNDDVR